MILFAVLPLVLIVLVGPAAASRMLRSAQGRPVEEFALRMRSAFGRVGGFVLTVAAGAGIALAIGWPLGVLARRMDPADHTAFTWVRARADTHWLASAMKILTQMGNNRETQILTVVASVLIGLIWARARGARFGLLPPAVLLVAYELEHQLQVALLHLAHRGHPPTTLGTYPSGGCARLVLTWGLIAYLLAVIFGKTRSVAGYLAVTFVAAAAYIEGFSRVYLSKHWVSDVVGGWIFGSVLLVVMIAATRVLDHGAATSGSGRHGREHDVSRTYAGAAPMRGK
ncbi:MAG TPA: phosphatase PAP2 family protein [Mycobacteriales bacterium]|nr:phosphatase PAP2 family protein [Mycobacteriales bacterium]